MLVPVQVNSSVINGIWRDDERSLLAVRLNGRLLVYRNAESNTAERIAAAKSPGLMLNHLTTNGLPRPASRLSPLWLSTWLKLMTH
jgi:hypothetical protein